MNSRSRLCFLLSSILVISQLLAAMHVSVHAGDSARQVHVHYANQFGFAPDLAERELPDHQFAGHESGGHENTEEALSCLNYHMLLATPACLSGNAAVPGCTWLNLQKAEPAAVTALFTVPTIPAIRGPPLSS